MEEQKNLEAFEPYKDVEGDVWQPKATGEVLEGVLVNKLEPVGELSSRYYLDTGKGVKMVWGTAVLDQRMSLVSVGNKVKISYLGKTKTKTGKREVHIWKVEQAQRKTTKEELA